MLSVERYNLILELIKQKKNIKLNEIVEELKISDFLKKMCYYTDEVIKMLSVERYNLILELIKQKKNIKLNEIVEELKISEATARRDLNKT